MKIKTAIAVFLFTIFPTGGSASEKSPLPTATPEQARLIDAIVQVESQGRADAIGDDGKAVGILQIHTVLVDDVNRILGKAEYSYKDRLDKTKSYQMFIIYTNHYTPSWDPEKVSRRWVSGPKGDLKKCSIPYWNKVQKLLKRKQS